MNQLLHCLDNANEYPRKPSLGDYQTYDRLLDALKKRLDRREKDLFCSDGASKVNVLQCKNSRHSFVDNCIETYDGLRTYLGFKEGQLQPGEDPQSQFIFIHAENSRDRLLVTRKIMVSLLTYYQIMPAFLDFVFPFGNTQDTRDFFFSSFKHETRLLDQERGLRVDQLGRSGLRLQLSYSLWAPAETGAYENWAWSVQPISIYHSFDFESGRMLWLLIKGDPKVKDQVASALRSVHHPKLRNFSTRDACFDTSLATHEFLSDWAGENWRWYINFLKEKVQEITDPTLNVTINKESVIAALRTPEQTIKPIPDISEKPRPWTAIRRVLTWEKEKESVLPVTELPAPAPTMKLPPKLPPGMNPTQPPKKRDSGDFGINDIRKVERVEERTNEALLILNTQISVLKGILAHYGTVLRSKDAPKDMATNCSSALAKFEISISGAIADMESNIRRLETLSHTLGQRKNLMSIIIEYQNMQASSWLATQARESSEKMEHMTRRMERIAEQTQKETVSMKVITVITLIFLPATFVSTLMSTDIVTFKSKPTHLDHKVVSTGALHLFLEITLILMALTVMMWIGTYFVLNWRQKRQWDRAETRQKEAATIV